MSLVHISESLAELTEILGNCFPIRNNEKKIQFLSIKFISIS